MSLDWDQPLSWEDFRDMFLEYSTDKASGPSVPLFCIVEFVIAAPGLKGGYVDFEDMSVTHVKLEDCMEALVRRFGQPWCALRACKGTPFLIDTCAGRSIWCKCLVKQLI